MARGVSRANVILIGFMGCGKSTVGRLCAQKLGFRFVDSDAAIVAREGAPIPALFAERGEAAFRQTESEVLADLLCRRGQVIATGGGAVTVAQNTERMRASGFVVLLEASEETLLKRVGGGRNRPLLSAAGDPAARIAELLAIRKPLYEAAAHARISTDQRAPWDIACEVSRRYREHTG